MKTMMVVQAKAAAVVWLVLTISSCVDAGCLSVNVCANDLPTGRKTCAIVTNQFESAIQCAQREECPSTAGSFAGNCAASHTWELPKWGCTETNCFIAAEGLNATDEYQIDLTCSEAQQRECQAHLLSPALTTCNDETAQRMQRYLDCFRACSGNEYTTNFYAGVCQGTYRLLGCPFEQNTNEWKQCFYPTYKLSTTTFANTAAPRTGGFLLLPLAALVAVVASHF